MEYDLTTEIEATKLEFRRRWGIGWQVCYCREHDLFCIDPRSGKEPDISRAPVPPWKEYGTDPEFVGIRWTTGFAVITAKAFAKMPQSKLKILTGGKR